MKIDEKLIKVQAALKAPKSQYNKFGGYSYRNCEDILEAAKPLCLANGCAIYLTDEIFTVESRVYVKATAHFRDVESDQSVSATAYAREEESKKGMDGSQVTGSASSYARKYALNGLLCIDDTKDSDFAADIEAPKAAQQNTKSSAKGKQVAEPNDEAFDASTPINAPQKPQPVQYASTNQITAIEERYGENVGKLMQKRGVSRLNELTSDEADNIIRKFDEFQAAHTNKQGT